LVSDYISLKFNFHFETLTLAPTNVTKMVEVVEKSLKLFLAFQEQPEEALSYFSNEYGHNLEKLRRKAESYDCIFEDGDIKQFTKPFDDRAGNLYQKLRYGSHTKIEGFKTNLNSLMPIVDKIFFNSIFRLDENWRKMLIGDSILYFLITNSNLSQSNNPELLLQAIRINNPYLEEFTNYCNEIKKERDNLLGQIQAIESNNPNQL
jgi:hypothetical protein